MLFFIVLLVLGSIAALGAAFSKPKSRHRVRLDERRDSSGEGDVFPQPRITPSPQKVEKW